MVARFLLLLGLCILGWSRTDFVSVQELQLPFPLKQGKEPILQILKKLQEPFYYLGQGRQSLVFTNAGKDVVLKLFRKSYIEVPWYTQFLLDPKKEIQKRLLRKKFYEESYLLAEESLAQETALLYLHFGPTTTLPKVQLKTRSSQVIEIDLNSCPFLIQRKVDPFFSPLLSAIERKDKEEVERRIEAFFAYLNQRMSLSIADLDRDVLHNFGWEGNALVHLDPGRLLIDPSLDRKEEWEKGTRQLLRWLQKYGPEYVPFFTMRLENLR